MFGSLVVMYLFLGGCGAGMLFTVSTWDVVRRRSEDAATKNATADQTRAFRVVRGRCYATGFAIVCVAAFCLLADLGRPDRFMRLFLYPSWTSVISFGTFVLTGLIAVAGYLAIDGNLRFYRFSPSPRLLSAIDIACAVLAVAVMTYTGVYLEVTKAVAFWDSPLVPCLFVLSSLSTGAAAVCFIADFIQDSWLLATSFTRIHAAHVIVLALEAFALGAFVVFAASGRGEAPTSLALWLDGPLQTWFFGGVLLVGICVPLIGELYLVARRRGRRRGGRRPISLLLVDAFCLFGGYALRYCFVAAGLH